MKTGDFVMYGCIAVPRTVANTDNQKILIKWIKKKVS